MATTKADIITAMRTRVGDDTVGSYFLTDAQWGSLVDNAGPQLKSYAQKESEVAVPGNGTASYTLPATVAGQDWKAAYIRDDSDPQTDRPLTNYRVIGTQLYTDYEISVSQDLVFFVRAPYVMDTDTIPAEKLEIIYLLCELGYIRHAIHRRVDFEQWAAINRADASVSALVTAAQEIRRQLADYAKNQSNGADVYDLGSFE